MKKISLILALLLCLVPVLSACGANSSPESAVKAALDVKYGDGDADVEKYWAVAYNYNLDILDLLDDKEEASDLKDGIREARKDKKGALNQLEDLDDMKEELEIDKYSQKYEIISCDTYKKGSDAFDGYLESFAYASTAVEDEVEAVAVVSVLTKIEMKKDKETAHKNSVNSYTCYKIDGKWYVEG